MLRLTCLVPAAALALSACATTPYTGPVEVTRFVAQNPEGLGQGPIFAYVPGEVGNEAARTAFKAAVEDELRKLGYTIVLQEGRGVQVAIVRTSRRPIAAAPRDRQGPVNVGIGGQAGSFGSGAGVGVGVNLGGGRESPQATTLLEVRIVRPDQTALWEGRAQIETGVKSPYSQIDTSARALAAALFQGFPGGNGETVTIPVRKLQGNR